MSNYLRESTTLFTYKDPVSPHLAAVAEQRVVHDDVIVSSVKQQLQRFTAELQRLGPSSKGLTLVETAGGVASPGPSGTLQVRCSVGSVVCLGPSRCGMIGWLIGSLWCMHFVAASLP
eukprot:GHRR01030226.1.p3 GENE.GHRR01030226.1~~GHRR01030226.1.p3  ORF type:complete len:118 (+),score=36.65 GHRR01030226.1:1129-1482(+)